MIAGADEQQIVRASRYVSAPLGAYPAPVPAGSTELDPVAPLDRIDPSATVAMSAASASAAVGHKAAAAEESESRGIADDSLPTERHPDLLSERWAEPSTPAIPRGFVWLARLIGLIFGAVVGVGVGLSLAAVSRGGPFLAQVSRPLELWRSIDDPVIIASICLVAAGCVLLGFSIGGRSLSSDP
jgi:hypothetical protein